MSERISVDEFGPAPKCAPETYPGRRPDGSYLFCEDHIIPICEIPGEEIEKSMIGKQTLDEMMGGISDKYMIVGYGSNVNPAQLRLKFSESTKPIPVLKGIMHKFDIVYESRITKYGAIPANITESDGTVEVWVNILDDKQLEIMDKTEGRGKYYHLGQIETDITLSNGEVFSPVYSYVADKNLAIDDVPIRLAEIPSTKSSLRGMRQAEIQNKVCAMTGVCNIDVTNNIEEINKKLKKHTMPNKIDYTSIDTCPKTIFDLKKWFV